MGEHLNLMLERAVRLHADREAVTDGQLRWTYRDLDARVGGFDAALDDLGLADGDVVAVLAANSAAHLVAWLAIPRSGRVLNDLNVRLAFGELEFILQDSGARALIVDDTFVDHATQLQRACPQLEHLIHAGSHATQDGFESFEDMTLFPARPASAIAGDRPAGIFYTGGTTGLPKGVILTHGNLVANAKHVLIELGYTGDEVYLHAAPMFHAADGLSTYAITWVGGRHVTIPGFDPARWIEAVETESVTACTLVPTMVNMIVNHPGLADHDLTSLRAMFYGGAPMPVELLRSAMAALPCDWNQLYGMTEAAPLVTHLGPDDHRLGAAGDATALTRLRSAGVPVVGVEADVRLPDGTVAAAGEPGEIWVRGPNVMPGYWNRPDESDAALDAEGWYHSGDAAYRDEDGYLYIVDRLKDMIISGGENVYSTEVENALYQHPAVLECAVFGVPDDTWGERVHAAIVCKPGVDADFAALVEHCRPLIAGYKIPRSIEFHAEPLPKSGAGKLLKRELRQPHWSDAGREEPATGVVPG